MNFEDRVHSGGNIEAMKNFVLIAVHTFHNGVDFDAKTVSELALCVATIRGNTGVCQYTDNSVETTLTACTRFINLVENGL